MEEVKLKRFATSTPLDASSKRVTRFCIVERDNAVVLAEVSTELGKCGVNIVSNTSRVRGALCFQVLDLETAEDAKVKALIESVPGVISCSIGSFSAETGAIYLESAPVRLCIVTENAPGVLGKVSSLIGVELGLKIQSHVNRSRDNLAYNVFDIENEPKDWEEVCQAIETMPQVYTCTIGHFKAGEMAGISAKTFSSAMSTYSFDTGNDSETEDTLSVKSSSTAPPRRPALSWSTDSAVRPAPFRRSLSNSKDTLTLSPTPEEYAEERPRLSSSNSAAKVTTTDYYDEGSKETARPKKLTLMDERTKLTRDASKLVIVMVGLPARGKSFTARKLKRFLAWRNRVVKIFNAGKYRRERSGSADLGTSPGDRADFFRSENEEGTKVRQAAADRALKDLLRFLQDQKTAAVGIFDATNSTQERRLWIVEQCKSIASVVFVETICDDQEVLNENLLAKIRNSPDFAGMDEETALEDLKVRISNYAKVYEPLSDDSMSYIKLYNMSTKILANRIYGRLARSILPYMLSLHVALRPIWFVRAGLAEDSRISLNPEYELLDPSTESKASRLSEMGLEFSRKLALWIQTALWLRENDEDDGEAVVNRELSGNLEEILPKSSSISTAFGSKAPESGNALRKVFDQSDEAAVVRKADGTRAKGAVLKVLSSTLPRAEQTAQIALSFLEDSNEVEPCPMLNPLDKGELGGLSMEEIKNDHNNFYSIWARNRYTHRFPGGESYYDLATRLEPVLIEIEQQTAPVLVVSHVSCIQALLAYYLGVPVEQAMKISVPMHKVIEVTPTMGGSWELNFYDV